RPDFFVSQLIVIILSGKMTKRGDIMKRVKRYTTILFAAILFSTLAIYSPTGQAQEAITVVDQGWDATFRDNLTFTLTAESEAEIVEVELFYQVVGQIATSRNAADFTPGTSVEAKFVI